MPSVVFTRCAKLTCCEVQLSFFYAHDSHLVIKGNVDMSYEDTENMNIKKEKNEVI